MYDYAHLVQRLSQQVRRQSTWLVRDPASPDDGAVVQPSAGYPNIDAPWLANACWAFLAEGSPLRGDGELLADIRRHIGYAQGRLSPEGLLDLMETNWASPPDTAFAVESLAAVAMVARRQAAGGDGPAAELLAPLEPLVRRMASGIIGRGFHTPNHRWVVCAALAMAMRLWPDLPAGPYIEAILAETIDINDDGEFIERSAGIYNAVCDRALIHIADFLSPRRPELLDAVRANLELSTRLLNADYTIVTGFSGRQDRGQAIVPTALAESYFTMAHRDGRGDWLAIAGELVARGQMAGCLHTLLRPLMLSPELRDAALSPRPSGLGDISLLMTTAGLWRSRRGELAATAGVGSPDFLSLQAGPLRLRAVTLGTTYFGNGSVVFDAIEPLPHAAGVRLSAADCAHANEAAYRLPLGRPMRTRDEFVAAGPQRERWALPRLSMEAVVAEVPSGLELRLTARGGVQRLLYLLEFCFEGPGQWQADGAAMPARNGESCFLTSGFGTFSRGGWAIRIGPGDNAHRLATVRGAVPHSEGFRVLIAMQGPLQDRPVQIQTFGV